MDDEGCRESKGSFAFGKVWDGGPGGFAMEL